MARLSIRRGDIYLLSPAPRGDPKRRRAVVVVSRQTLCDSKADKVVCAPVNTLGDGRSTEVSIGPSEGLKHESVINCDQLVLVAKHSLTDYKGSLSSSKLGALRDSLRIALDVR